MKQFEKLSVALLTGVGIALFSSGTSDAAFSSLTRSSATAEAVLTGAGSVQMSVAIKKVSDNSDAPQISFTGVTLPTSWKVADHYIQVTQVITASGGGIQTYTDNTATDATPKFTGDKTVLTPAGLIDTTDTTKKLPTAWSIRSSTSPLTVLPVDPGANAGESYLWFYHLDAAQVAITTSNATAFVQGDPFVTVANVNGIHFAQGPLQFGAPAAATSNYYLEANFAGAATPRTYRTSKLILESFTQ